MVRTGVVGFFSILILLSACDEAPEDRLKKGFLAPPDSARAGVYWYFMDGNMSREAMTADLEAMKEAGIGYVLFLEVDVGVPRGDVDLLGDEWQDLFVHAVRECERLGIRLVMGSGPGWAGSGGPWVQASESMMHLVGRSTIVEGPTTFSGSLPEPPPLAPYFGDGSLPQWMRDERAAWYEDVALLAFPTPATSDTIGGILEKANYVRGPYTSRPGIPPRLPARASYPSGEGGAIDPGRIVDLSKELRPDGTLTWDVPPGKWTLLRMGTRNNGAVTRPAPEPGVGFESDKFDTLAFDRHFEAYLGRLIERAEPRPADGKGGWTMVHIDSWEMGAQNWTPRFRVEFTRRRGYDPLPFLPAYTGLIVDNRTVSERFLWDVRQTSSELIVEYHARRFKELGRRHGFRLSIEPYDMNPASDFDLGAVADVPMCEFWSDGLGFNSSFSCIEATSIAHVTGASVVAAEAFTAMPQEAWKQHPGRMKNQGDWAFCMGVNRFFYHTFAHQSLSDELLPGMTMGPYGVHWDRNQTWWEMAPAYHEYVARVQFVLSQGRAVADILYLTHEGAPEVFTPPPSALEGTETMPDKRGYSFDGVSPPALMELASVQDGKIVFSGGASYEVLVLPDVETMTHALAGKLRELIEAGARVVGEIPDVSPSLADGYPEDRPAGARGEKDGSYPSYDEIVSLLAGVSIPPDFVSSGSIRYTHRRLEDRDVYFISNRTGESVTDTVVFRDGSPGAEWWDPVTGDIRRLLDVHSTEGGVALSVRLNPWQSGFVVFYSDGYEQAGTELAVSNFPEARAVQVLAGPWTVSFDSSWGGPPGPVVFDTLSDWSVHLDTGIRHYSGTALYRLDFQLEAFERTLDEEALFVDLGQVEVMARVRLNGEDLGTVWTPPRRLPIGDAARAGANVLEIEVANLWVNRLIGDEAYEWDGITDGKWPDWLINQKPRPTGRRTFTTHRFYKAADPLSPSGLLGPVRIVAFQRP